MLQAEDDRSVGPEKLEHGRVIGFQSFVEDFKLALIASLDLRRCIFGRRSELFWRRAEA